MLVISSSESPYFLEFLQSTNKHTCYECILCVYYMVSLKKVISGHLSIYGHHNSKDINKLATKDQCTIEKLILEVPEGLTPTEEK